MSKIVAISAALGLAAVGVFKGSWAVAPADSRSQ